MIPVDKNSEVIEFFALQKERLRGLVLPAFLRHRSYKNTIFGGVHFSASANPHAAEMPTPSGPVPK